MYVALINNIRRIYWNHFYIYFPFRRSELLETPAAVDSLLVVQKLHHTKPIKKQLVSRKCIESRFQWGGKKGKNQAIPMIMKIFDKT